MARASATRRGASAASKPVAAWARCWRARDRSPCRARVRARSSRVSATSNDAEPSVARRLTLLGLHGPNEALHLGLVVVVVDAGADERVDSARGRIEPRQ